MVRVDLLCFERYCDSVIQGDIATCKGSKREQKRGSEREDGEREEGTRREGER